MGDRNHEVYREIISAINEILETTWTDIEVIKGKEVDVSSRWRAYMGSLITKYRTAGWIISRKVEINTSSPGCPRDYLIFKNPTWQICPSEIRSTGVRR
tara:strand:+ start:463 stop:759 length:297 start_codon:yes stop_codon:yes gene_type:complete